MLHILNARCKLLESRFSVVKNALGTSVRTIRSSGVVQSRDEIEEFNHSMRDVFGTSADDNTPLASMGNNSAQHFGESPRDQTVRRATYKLLSELLAVSLLVAGAFNQVYAGQTDQMTHIDSKGEAVMVDVGSKAETQRVAVAVARVILGPTAFSAVSSNTVQKGDVLSVARIAGILAAKQTANIIPLCHSLALDRVSVGFELQREQAAVAVTAEARCSGKTGVEMEAMTAVSVAALTIYDMCKALSKEITINDIRLAHKSGGRSGSWTGSKPSQTL